eukprot:11744730-Karenia_brevis.AAC.1
MRNDIESLKADTNVARVEAEEAITQAGLAHGAAEEAANMVHELKERVKEIEKTMAKMNDVKAMIDEAMKKSELITT